MGVHIDGVYYFYDLLSVLWIVTTLYLCMSFSFLVVDVFMFLLTVFRS